MSPSLRTGIDLIEIRRFRDAYHRYDQRLLQRLFTPIELAENGVNMASLAARFAAKEAVAKAFGTGIGRISWQDIEIQRGCSGEPILQLHAAAQEMAEEQHITTWSISLSHTHRHAIAVVVAMIDQA
ncbi:MAG: holo-[acyl-carrier-protein] synthase [Chloroflexi bacterium RBG_13_50_21]|nr:MAG: holo-[acyl-carrier-protein] synthase [Chloroflexi bacterium RBG_13_50_21]OGO59100.1 MAG: holo-[acyl-carrier-protein] synthase [Chloroflexi bacterium RBG_19FT_COMBO_47_9]